MTRRILVTSRSFAGSEGEHKEVLRRKGFELTLAAREHPLTSDELAAAIPGHSGAILGLDTCDATVISAAPELRVIARQGVGTDNVDLDAATRHGVVVTNTPGANGTAVAELAIALMLILARDLRTHIVRPEGAGHGRRSGWELLGKTLGVIGFGAIGRDVARRAQAFGMQVLAHDPCAMPPFEGLDVELIGLRELLEAADVLTLHAALTEGTMNLMGGAEFESMKPGAYLINTARAELVDQDALLDALRHERLGGFASDVVEDAGTVPAALLEHPRVVVTPHIGATTTEAVERMSLAAARSVIDVLAGTNPEHVVNRDVLEGRNPHG